MKVTLIPSSHASGDAARDQYLTSFLIDDTLAIDAGSLGFYGTPQEQARVRHVVITHTHVDHIASLPIFVENAFEGRRDCVTIHGSDEVLDCLRRDVFNDRVWPDFLRLSTPEAPFLKLQRLEVERPFELEGLRLTAVPVDHVVPTLGLIVEGPDAAVVIPSDTGPTDAIWRRTRATPHLKAVFLETAFPNAMAKLAEASKHLTPAMFAAELEKLPPGVRTLVVHIKPRFQAQVRRELEALGLPNVEVCRPGVAYEF